jgi:hypothetical protein
LQKDIQPLLAGKVTVKFAVRLFGFRELPKLGDRLLHVLNDMPNAGFAEENPRLPRLGRNSPKAATDWDIRKRLLRVRAAPQSCGTILLLFSLAL